MSPGCQQVWLIAFALSRIYSILYGVGTWAGKLPSYTLPRIEFVASGWLCLFDPSSNKKYYWDQKNNVTTYEKPTAKEPASQVGGRSSDGAKGLRGLSKACRSACLCRHEQHQGPLLSRV
jgi:hypothetical protein